jgi:hypothetical protein
MLFFYIIEQVNMNILPVETLVNILDFCSPLPKLRAVCSWWRDAIDMYLDRGMRDYNNFRVLDLISRVKYLQDHEKFIIATALDMKKVNFLERNVRNNYKAFAIAAAKKHGLYTELNAQILEISEAGPCCVNFGEFQVEGAFSMVSGGRCVVIMQNKSYGHVISIPIGANTVVNSLKDFLLKAKSDVFQKIRSVDSNMIDFWKLSCLCLNIKN